MLDDLKLIHQRDAQDALGIAEKQYAQLTQALKPQGNTTFRPISNIVVAGMGGSALGASYIHTWGQLMVPFEIVRDYDLPLYVGGDTLVIASSYSGNTEETLSALAQAETRGAQIAVIAAGGKLEEVALQKGYLYYQLPHSGQPRYAVLSSFRALLETLKTAGIITAASYTSELTHIAAALKAAAQRWRPDVATASNAAKHMAFELMGKSIVVYGGPKMYPAAYKWKISFNENAKHVAWTGQLPEFNHNEFIGWSKQPVEKPYAVIDLCSTLENKQVQKRFVVSAKLLSGMRPQPYVVRAQGDTPLEQLLWTILFGDFVSLYLAILNGVNPSPVDLVEKFKAELAAS